MIKLDLFFFCVYKHSRNTVCPKLLKKNYYSYNVLTHISCSSAEPPGPVRTLPRQAGARAGAGGPGRRRRRRPGQAGVGRGAPQPRRGRAPARAAPEGLCLPPPRRPPAGGPEGRRGRCRGCGGRGGRGAEAEKDSRGGCKHTPS